MESRTIVHILPWPSVGGVEMATVRLARAIEGPEFTSVAFCPRGGDAVHALFARTGIPTVAYDAPEPSYRHLPTYLRASLALARQLRASRAALVHCSDMLAAYRCGLAGVLAGVPVIAHVRGRVTELSLRDRSFLWPIRRFVFVSREARTSFAVRVSDRRATVIHDGIDRPSVAPDWRAEVRAELDIAPSAPVIGMVARVAPAKDYPTLIRAARRVVDAHPDVRFLIVGQRSGVREYAEHYGVVTGLLEGAGLTDHFVFTDHRDDVDRLISAMDIGILVTHGEGLPLVMLETMAQGKPFVATNVGGIPEVIRHGETGVLVPPADADALASALLALLDDPVHARALGEAARTHVARDFARDGFAARMRALYREVIPAHHSTVAVAEAS